MRMVTENVLYRTSRPGYPAMAVNSATVAAWTDSAKAQGVRTICCLLDAAQLAYYAPNLLQQYKDAGFSVLHRPIPDYTGISAAVLRLAPYDLACSEKGVLVHCSAGLGRTGEWIRHLEARPPGDPAPVQAIVALARSHCAARGLAHFTQVTRLALRIFDLLPVSAAAAFKPSDRVLLWAAAMLHDIGTVVDSGPQHGWRAADQVLDAKIAIPELGITAAEIATVAAGHTVFDQEVPAAAPLGPLYGRCAELWPGGQIPLRLQQLIAILRVADGFDRTLQQEVTELWIRGARLVAAGWGDLSCNRGWAAAKQALLEEVLGLTVDLR